MMTTIEFCERLVVLIELKDWKGIERAIEDRTFNSFKAGINRALVDLTEVRNACRIVKVPQQLVDAHKMLIHTRDNIKIEEI